ncbi:hypothetical protein A5904_04655 [Acidithiobacillus caldus]|uniref:hypothetical protein n=1 Tax=Acidithiobacillus caldus TaxID=33059 RepID=UPI0005A1748A|nr:hypothetical protein [Acidithiobacillus caldus]AUW32365.1 hypothetical protein A5904_04655 [Acidithiobacillus caldus]
MADHMAGHALDVAIMPGAGLGFELVKIMAEMMAPTPGASVAPLQLPQLAPQPASEPAAEEEQRENEEEEEAEQ